MHRFARFVCGLSLAAAVLLPACSDDIASDSDGTSAGNPRDGTDGGVTASSAGETVRPVITGCDLSPCRGKSITPDGFPLDPCCVAATTCGVEFLGCHSMATSPFYDAGPAETIVHDPVCPDGNLIGIPLTGCCDRTGVCGFVPTGPNPWRCATRAEANLPPEFTTDADPEKRCDYPADGG